MSNEYGQYIDSPWTWRERLRFKLYPPKYCQLPEAPGTYADCVVVITIVELSLLDRLRVLVSGRLKVETRTVTENIVGDTKTASVAAPCL